jgi:hypothetical protein
MVIKSKMRWAGHVARMGEIKMNTILWLENIKGTDHSEDLSIEGNIILECILGKQEEICGLDASGSG